MWQRSFVATSVVLGGTVDDGLRACEGSSQRPPRSVGGAPEETALDALVGGLRGSRRTERATALATAVRDIVLAIDEVTLR